MSEWKKVKLGEITSIKTGKLDSNASVSNGIYPFFTCDPSTLSIDKWAYDTEAILLAGNNASGNYTAKYYKGKFNAYQRTYIIETLNPQFASVRFMAYAMNQQLQLLKVMSTGSTTKFLTMKMLTQLTINLPQIEIQHRIASILSRYDSLIENYQKQIKLLEEAAQRLYKEWFVDLRFPGHENTKIIDGVPEGWEKKKLCEFTGITDGTHDSPKQVEIGLPLVTGRCIVDGSIDFSQAYNISEEDVIKINKRSAVEDGDILLSNIGTIGKVCRISKSGNYAVKNMIIFKPHDAIHSCFLHRFLTDNNTQMDFLQQAAGTSQKFVSLSFIRNTLILRPSDTILNLFYNHSEKYFNYVQTLQSQLRLLTEARDRLLPKLMSGEIEI